MVHAAVTRDGVPQTTLPADLRNLFVWAQPDGDDLLNAGASRYGLRTSVPQRVISSGNKADANGEIELETLADHAEAAADRAFYAARFYGAQARRAFLSQRCEEHERFRAAEHSALRFASVLRGLASQERACAAHTLPQDSASLPNTSFSDQGLISTRNAPGVQQNASKESHRFTERSEAVPPAVHLGNSPANMDMRAERFPQRRAARAMNPQGGDVQSRGKTSVSQGIIAAQRPPQSGKAGEAVTQIATILPAWLSEV